MSRNRFNVRFFVIVCLLVIAIAAGFFFLHRYQVGHQAKGGLDRARQYGKQADATTEPRKRLELIGKSWQEYNKYLVAHPNDVDVLFEEAKFLADEVKWIVKNGDPMDASKWFGMSRGLFERALRQDASRRDIREEFINVLFEFGYLPTAIQHIHFLCDFPESPQDLQVLFDRHQLWDKAVTAEKAYVVSGDQYDLSPLLKKDRVTVDHGKLLELLGDDFWIILEDPKMLGILGRCQLRLNNPEPAIDSLTKAVTLAPDNLEAYEALIMALWMQDRDSNEIEDWLREMIKANPDRFRAYLIRGRSRLQRILTDPAKVLISSEWDALQATQKSVQELLELAEKLIPDAEVTKEWSRDFRAVVNLAPVDGEAITKSYYNALLKAVLHVGPAVELMEAAISKQEKASSPNSVKSNAASLGVLLEKDLAGCRDGLYLAAQCKLQQFMLDKKNLAQLDTARKLAEAMLALFPENQNVYTILADIEIQAKNSQKMIDWMIRGTKNVKEKTLLYLRLGAALAQDGKMDEAREVLQQLEDSGADKHYVSYLAAALDMHNKNWTDAAAKLEKIRPSFMLVPAELGVIDIWLAECYGQLGRLKDKREAYARAARFNPVWMPALVGLARARQATGQLEKAIQDYRTILKLPDVDPQIYLEYAQLLLRVTSGKPKGERDFKPVEKAIDRAASVVSDSLAVPMLRADLFVAKGEIEKARALLTALYEGMDKNKEKLLQKRKLLLSEAKSLSGDARAAKLDEAKFLLEQSHSCDIYKPKIWAAIGSLASQQGDRQAAGKFFQQAESKLKDSPELRWIQARKLVQTTGGNAKEIADALHSLAENTDAFDRNGRLKLFRQLAFLAIQLNDISQAEKLTESVLREEPGDVGMQKVRFQVAMIQKDVKTMQTILAQMQKSEDTASAFWNYGEGVRLYMLSQEQKKPDLAARAVKLLSTATKMEPNWYEPALFLGQILESQGKLEEASDLYFKAVQNGMRHPKVIQKLAGLLMMQYRYEEADQMFELLAQVQGDDTSSTGLSASYVKAQLGNFEQALDMARKTCEDSKNYQDFLWLARILETTAKRAHDENREEESKKLYGEAEQALRKSIELNPKATGAWVGLVHLYTLFGQKEEALKTITQAKEKLPKKEVDLVLAQAYETLGEIPKAATHFRKAIRNAPKDANVARMAAFFFLKYNFPDDSKALLKRIANKQVDASASQVAWANRALSLLMLKEKGDWNPSEAIALIDKNLKVNPNSIPDLFAKATLLADDPTGLHREEAIVLLEKIKSLDSSPGLAVQLKLADLYYLTGRWRDYRELMRVILGQVGGQREIVSKYVVRLAEHGEYSETKVWLDKLKQIDPDSTNTFFTECAVAFSQKQYDTLLKLANDFSKKPPKKAGQKPLQQLSAALSICQQYALKLQEEGKIALAKKFQKHAEKYAQKLVELEPRTEADLAALYSQQGQYEKAIAILRKFVDEADPKTFGKIVYGTLSGGDLPEDQILEIQKLLEQVHKAHPDEVFTTMMLAFCAEKLDQTDKEEAILREALGKHPKNIDLMNYLAVTLALHGKNLEEAEKLINETIQIASSKPDLYDSRAMILLAQGRPKEAMHDLQKAIAMNPQVPSFYFHLAQALQQQGLKKQAKEILERAHRSGFREEGLSPGERRDYRRLKRALE